VNLSTFIYTVILRPKPLKALANAAIRAILPRELKTQGVIVALNPADPVISGALLFGVYEKPETEFFRAVCRPGMTVLDIGANVGYYTALAAARVDGGKIVALEPDRENFGFLEATVAANSARNVVCIRKAASSKSGVMTLFSSASNRGDNRLYANEFPGTQSQVEVCTIDELLSDLGIPTVHLVKIDVQGFEGQVMRGMNGLLRSAPEITILMEFWPEGLRQAGTGPEELLALLESASLESYELSDQGRLAKFDHADLIARHPGRNYTNIVAHRGGTLPGLIREGGAA
jgi:FkbM family methyltransferase